ncbi:oxidoreductase [Pseudomonas kribbensis]|uniref:Oxidoreductase n=1 Tax=Pseudomonas kribbensis TaxID=1628086 RepID=A0A4Y8VG27_9PSED|nr:oxidoreductase [Pseudomonas kribbensis]
MASQLPQGTHRPCERWLASDGHHAIFTPGVRAAGNTRLGVSSEATGYAQ